MSKLSYTSVSNRSNCNSDFKLSDRIGNSAREKTDYSAVDCEQHKKDVDCDSSDACEIPLLFKPEPEIDLSTKEPKSIGRSGKGRVGFVEMECNDYNSKKTEINEDLRKLSRKGTGSVRYNQPRLSLLGKPLVYKFHRRDVRYRRIQSRIYNFLERPKCWNAFMYHILICLVFIGALVLSTLSTINRFEPEMSVAVMVLEPVLLIWLVTEYVIRIWSSGCRSRFQGWSGRLRFAQRPLCIVDLVIIIATFLVIVVGSTTQIFAASTLRGLRFFQILRMVRIDRKAGSWKLLASVVWAHRRELLTTLYIGFLGLLFSSFLVYLAEKDYDPERFNTFADALWWGVITLCTVGYGDVVPSTYSGKIIAAFSAVLGISFFALPAGILGSGFALMVQQQQRQKHLIRRRVPAATLIQCLWRCYAADANSMSIATWKPHMVPCPSPTMERSFKSNSSSFVSRFSTRRKERTANTQNLQNAAGNMSPHSPLITRRDSKKTYPEEEIPETLQNFVNRTWSQLSLATGLVDQRVERIAMLKENSASSVNSEKLHSEEDLDLSPRVRELTDVHKRTIRALRKIKYFVARRKFREALRPYDVKDVMEQYSAGHVDMLGRVKSLQSRLDQILGKAGSKNKDVYESKVSLSSRIVKVERQVEDIESKLDILIDLYKEDRKLILQKLNETSDATTDIKEPVNKPRSILVENKQYSEPSSPIVSIPQRRFMQRNHSDLGSRIRKRVTYRLHSSPVCPSSQDDKYFLQEHTIPRSLSASYPTRSQFYGSEDSIKTDKSRTKQMDKLDKVIGNINHNVLSIPELIYPKTSEKIRKESLQEIKPDDPSPHCETIHRSNSQQSLPDAASTCSDPFSPEEETTILLGEEMNEAEDNEHKSQDCGENSYQGDKHCVLVPVGTMKALSADVTDV